MSSQPSGIAPAQPAPAGMWAALGLVYVIWGSTYLAIRIVGESLPAFGSAAVRFGTAAIVLALIIAVSRGPRTLRISWRQFGASALVGALLIACGNGLVVLAESPRYGLPSGVAALVVALTPVLMVLLRTATGDRPRAMTVVGVAIGFVGVGALFLPGLAGDGPAVPTTGAILVLGAVTGWCVGSFATRWLPMPRNPFVASVYEMLAGAAVMTVIAVGMREPAIWSVPDVPARAWFALGYLIIAGSLVAFTAFVWLLQHAPISLTSTYAYVNPVIALILGSVVAAEALTGQVLLAALTVVLGVILVVSTERRGIPEPEVVREA